MRPFVGVIRLEVMTKLREMKHVMSSKSYRREDSAVFDDIHDKNFWMSSESVSGPGSELEETEEVRALLPTLFSDLNIRTFLDVPCGDFSWMREIDFGTISYTGGDVVQRLVERNNTMYGSEQRRFLLLNIIKDRLPPADLVCCRDCLIHLSLRDGVRALSNIRASGAKYLLIITDPSVTANRPIHTGEYRAINLELPPFRMKRPLSVYRDRHRPRGGERLIDPDKSLALYKLR